MKQSEEGLPDRQFLSARYLHSELSASKLFLYPRSRIVLSLQTPASGWLVQLRVRCSSPAVHTTLRKLPGNSCYQGWKQTLRLAPTAQYQPIPRRHPSRDNEGEHHPDAGRPECIPYRRGLLCASG